MKQRNAFPPNYIHSLDAAHMMLTALHCQKSVHEIVLSICDRLEVVIVLAEKASFLHLYMTVFGLTQQPLTL